MTKYVIITGGQLFNKGAESMTYIAVEKLKEKFPNTEIVVLSSKDYLRPEKEKNKYKFKILPRTVEVMYPLTSGITKLWGLAKQVKLTLSGKSNGRKERRELKRILNNSVAMVDISGYAFSNQFPNRHALSFLSRIEIAKKYNIDMYIMPQSFGPFEFEGLLSSLVYKKAKSLLHYPKVIFARENQGFNMLKDNFDLQDNLYESVDLVLLNQEVNKENVLENFELQPIPETTGVALIPNMKTFKHGDKKLLLDNYKAIIDHLLTKEKKVNIVRHSFEDIEACKMIKNMYSNNDSVILIDNDYSCFEYDELVKKFDFIIGSRFHSIVHAYKNSVPAIAIGWAIKYHELLKTFDQQQYIFDVRKDMDTSQLLEAVDTLIKNHQKESKVISNQLVKLQTHNPFDKIH